MDNNNKPLYKVLNEQRTQGYLKIDYDHTNNKAPFTLAVGHLNTGLNWESVASVYNENDAIYLALTYNNLTPIADALRSMIAIFDRDLPDGSIGKVKCDEAKEALKGIS